jgi:poly-gamma-glutamate synthesis protein (capsule biosynthesis protein)
VAIVTRRNLITILLLLSVGVLTLTSYKFLNQNPLDKDPVSGVKGDEQKTFPTPTITQTNIVLTGDVMLGRKVMIESMNQGDYRYPFLKVADFLRKADLVFVNLENPIIEDCPIHEGGFTFCSPPESIEGLTYAGVDVVNLANNHSGNYGVEGIENTFATLQENGIESTGLNNLVILQNGEINFGFLGFNYVFKNQINPEDIQLVADSDEKVDVLVVAVHWGDEYHDSANPFQRLLAKELIVNGADIVVGHHPHWAQDAECLSQDGGEVRVVKSIAKNELESGVVCPKDTKPVFYSLGNFIFDQMWSEETRSGIIVRLTFEGLILADQQIKKTYIENWGQVYIVD